MPSASVPLPWNGSMHFFSQANEQHFICSTQCSSVLHKYGPLISQVILSWGHTPDFPAREQCPHSHPCRVSALLPRQRGIVTFSQPSPLSSIFSACSAYIMGWVCLSPLGAHLDRSEPGNCVQVEWKGSISDSTAGSEIGTKSLTLGSGAPLSS